MIARSNDNDLLITDAHLHLWDLSVINYPWLDEVPQLKKSFDLAAYRAATKGISVSNMIFLQCECAPEAYQKEVDYITDLAVHDPRIRGIVSYFPLEQPEVESTLATLTQNKLIKGIRRLEEEPISLYDNKQFINNMNLLHRYGLSFDLGIKAHQLPAAVRLVEACPTNRYMVDHLGKPAIKTGEFREWKRNITALAKNPRVYCKLSGLVTEADWKHWTIADLQPYVDVVLELFGTHRIAFGGDWPVVTLSSSYTRWLTTALALCRSLPDADLQRIFYQNALDFYRIDDISYEQI
ncbi:amidohydrolase family protein [Sphingobacterium pedocola]|uniref:Amidohydrolase n=1 Tax=Sphingobacterium pedocola TaxID=2082722 RepID=A0ABR9T233_9SPHI|nr:amidohydrolase family protein [Sphingobacterium pedocola]MBE8719402.1 amidohydrolase [Sphingobacterium pedocola]